MKIKVGVIFGGDSVEHEVSIITAIQAMENIDSEKYDIIPIYISKDRTWYSSKMFMNMEVFKDFDNVKKFAKKVSLTKKNNEFILLKTDGLFRKVVDTIDVAFPIVHGKGVEDGSLVGFLETIGLPYVGPSIIGAALGQDKVLLKQVLRENNINTPKYTWFYDFEYLNNSDLIFKQINDLEYPVIVKPANLGSTIGINVAHNEEEVKKAIEDAISYDRKILVEKMVPNLLEVNCAVKGNYEYTETSLIAEVLTDNELLTFNDKYLSGSKSKSGIKTPGKMSNSSFNIPANISKKVEEKIFELSKQTFKVLNLSGIARIDFLIDKKTEEVFVNEPNTIPGSLSFYMFKPKGIEYQQLLDDMINTAIKDYKDSKKKISTFDSNVLSTYNSGIKGTKGKI